MGFCHNSSAAWWYYSNFAYVGTNDDDLGTTKAMYYNHSIHSRLSTIVYESKGIIPNGSALRMSYYVLYILMHNVRQTVFVAYG